MCIQIVYDRIDLIDWIGFLYYSPKVHLIIFLFSRLALTPPHTNLEESSSSSLIFHLAFPRHVTYFSTLVTFDTTSILTNVDGRGTFASHVSVALAFKTPAFGGAVPSDVTKALAPMALLTSTTAHRTHGVSTSATKTTAESTSAAPASTHAYSVGAIAGDVPVFFTVVTIFDGAVFTRFGWFRALASDVTVNPAIVANGAVRTIAGYVTLFAALVTKAILRHDYWWNYFGFHQIFDDLNDVFTLFKSRHFLLI